MSILKATKRSLDDQTIRNAKSKDRTYEIVDGEGLSLRVMPSGTKTWTLRYRIDGLQSRMSLGKYPIVSLARAREKQAEALRDIENNIDPAKKAEEKKRARISEPSFSELFEEFWDVELSHKPTAINQRRMIKKDVLPQWEKLKIKTIRRRDAVLLIDEIRQRAPVTANRVQTILVRMFNFATERGLLDFSPLVGLRFGKESARSRVLNDDELKKLWKSLDIENRDVDMFIGTKLALKAILLTGQRPGEVCSMEWADIKQDEKMWVIPENKTKQREQQPVPLTDMMIEVLKQAELLSEKSAFVFTSARSPLYCHHRRETRPKSSEQRRPRHRAGKQVPFQVFSDCSI